MNPEYLSLIFSMDDKDHELWLALLGEWPFESFHDEENTITGYIQQHDLNENLIRFIDDHIGVYYVDYELNKVPDKNWNAVWESSFNPVIVGDYCYIRAQFHESNDQFIHEIIIAPKMAFGTGHHATTYMMIKAMQKFNFKKKTVFDFGCGTGILSILAAREGASEVFGVDIQPEAIENSIEHAEMNQVNLACEFQLGGIELAADEKFDIILANINRNVILEHLMQLKKLLDPKGYLLISGVMEHDGDMMKSTLAEHDFEILSSDVKDQWIQITATVAHPNMAD